MSRRCFATLFFVGVLVFVSFEVFSLFTAKNAHDYRLAKENAEELSVELSLISSAIKTGNHALFDDSVQRYRTTINRFADNEYTSHHQTELLQSLRDYSELLKNNSDEIDEFIELMDKERGAK